jgi:hypothetical protein
MRAITFFYIPTYKSLVTGTCFGDTTTGIIDRRANRIAGDELRSNPTGWLLSRQIGTIKIFYE